MFDNQHSQRMVTITHGDVAAGVFMLAAIVIGSML